MKKFINLFIAVVVLSSTFGISSCKCKKDATKTTTTAVVKDFEKEGYVKAIVIYSDLDACRYLLVLANETRLEPSANLATEFQQDQLAVWVKYTEKKGGMSVCMAGTLVDISDIQIRK